ARIAALPDEARFPPDTSNRMNLDYVGEEALLTHPYAFPAYGELAGLPPTFIVNSEIDDLRPSGEAFAVALAEAGNDVTVVFEPGTMHGHLNRPGDYAARTVARVADWLRTKPADA
ncbi:MAG: alpha/beta hydrolase, partial [Bifidobacteriaceae bacterium]|nr:alpha/beta hydrolase [Bifidobacteriaceae bacterium]